MDNLILIAIILLILGAAVAYIVKAKKRGMKCIGCPNAKTCGGRQEKMDSREGRCSGMCNGCSCCGGK